MQNPNSGASRTTTLFHPFQKDPNVSEEKQSHLPEKDPGCGFKG